MRPHTRLTSPTPYVGLVQKEIVRGWGWGGGDFLNASVWLLVMGAKLEEQLSVQLCGLLQETPSLRITNNGADKSRTAHISSTLRKVEVVGLGKQKKKKHIPLFLCFSSCKGLNTAV